MRDYLILYPCECNAERWHYANKLHYGRRKKPLFLHWMWNQAINKPWEWRQDIITRNCKYELPLLLCAASHFPHLPIHRPVNKHSLSSCSDSVQRASLCANLAYKSRSHSGQPRHNKTPRCPSVRLCIFFPPSLYATVFSGRSTFAPKCMHVSLSLHSQHRNVWVYCVACVQFPNQPFW